MPTQLRSFDVANEVQALVEGLDRIRRVVWEKCQRFIDAPDVALAEEAGDVAALPECSVELVVVLLLVC